MTKEAISKEASSPSDGSATPPSVEAFDHGKHRSTYEKVYNFFGFTKAYNFPICKFLTTSFTKSHNLELC